MASRPAVLVRRVTACTAGPVAGPSTPVRGSIYSHSAARPEPGPKSSPQSQRRHFSSTETGSSSFKSFFTSRQTSRSTTSAPGGDPRADFIAATSSSHIIALRKAYDALLHLDQASGFASSSHSNGSLSPGELMSAMTFLSSRAEPHALGLLKRIYADLPRWGVKREKRHFRAVLRGMCSAGHIQDAIDWSKQHADYMDADVWRLVLRSAIRHQPDLVPDVEAGLRSALGDKGLIGSDYGLLLRHMRVKMPEEREARKRLAEILGDSKKKGIWIGRDAEMELANVHLALGDLDRMGDLIRGWGTGLDDASGSPKGKAALSSEAPRTPTPAMWNTTIDYLAARQDVEGVKDAMIRVQEAGLAPYDKGMGFLVLLGIKRLVDAPSGSVTPLPSQAAIVEIFDGVENSCGAKASSVTWAEVIELFASRDLRMAQELYDEARARGVNIESHIARALIFPLCAQNPPDLRSAMDVYADLTSQALTITAASVRGRLLAIYSELLRAYAKVPSVDKDIPVRLLKDMRRFGLSLPTAALTSIVLSLIRASPDHITAFNHYAHLYALNPNALDAKAYSVIVSSFIGYSTPSSPFAPSTLVLELMKDMRKAGYIVSPHILTSLLSSYAAQARSSRRTGDDPIYRQTKLDSLTKAIGDIHNVLKLESIVEPDVPLLNALMDAYSRVGAYSSAFAVWDQLVERRAFEPKETVQAAYGPSVSIILDTCGWSGQAQRAKRIWAWARRHNLDGPGTKAWEGWLECLCRLGMMDEAAEMVIQRETRDGVVSVEMLRVLLKFCWTDKSAYRTIPPRIKDAFPGMWDQVKDVVETRTAREAVDIER